MPSVWASKVMVRFANVSLANKDSGWLLRKIPWVLWFEMLFFFFFFFEKCVAFVSVLKTAKFVVCKSLRCDMDGWRGPSWEVHVQGLSSTGRDHQCWRAAMAKSRPRWSRWCGIATTMGLWLLPYEGCRQHSAAAWVPQVCHTWAQAREGSLVVWVARFEIESQKQWTLWFKLAWCLEYAWGQEKKSFSEIWLLDTNSGSLRRWIKSVIFFLYFFFVAINLQSGKSHKQEYQNKPIAALWDAGSNQWYFSCGFLWHQSRVKTLTNKNIKTNQ